MSGSRQVVSLCAGCFIGSRLRSGLDPLGSPPRPRPGNSYFLLSVRPGDPVSCLASRGVLHFWAKAPGSSSTLLFISHCLLFATLRLPSGSVKRVRSRSICRLGPLSGGS